MSDRYIMSDIICRYTYKWPTTRLFPRDFSVINACLSAIFSLEHSDNIMYFKE